MILCEKILLEIWHRNLNKEGTWGNLLEQLIHAIPSMGEEIQKAQKMSLGIDVDFYERLWLQFVIDEVPIYNLLKQQAILSILKMK